MTFPTITVTPGSGATINALPPSGQATMANSLPVVIASDQAALTTASSPGSANWPTTQVSVGASATSILSSRAGRLAVVITNTGTTAVYLGGASVTTANGALLAGVAGASKTIPFTGAVFGIAASGSQTVTVEEFF